MYFLFIKCCRNLNYVLNYIMVIIVIDKDITMVGGYYI